ncbi:MoeA family protein [Fodinicurvata halophila]|uniref:hypothetical protein n=1 Tax=Fodinicurvata halophila TaxID=1419723 RepID=UPI00362A5271
MIPVEEALQRILEKISALPEELVSLDQARGRVLARPVTARVSHPPKAVSAMDGYAVRAADVAGAPVELEVAGHIAAGETFSAELGPGHAVRIFTGAQLPRGADAIVIQEDTEEAGEARVLVRNPVPKGYYVRPEGLDFQAGDIGVSPASASV